MDRTTIDPATLDALLAPHNRCDRPGVAVGIARHGVPVYRRWLGLASVDQPLALSPATRMRIGSTTKHMTCLAVMLLQEAGRLSIDDPVRRHIAEVGAWGDRATLAQLMSHVSGIRDSLDVLTLTNDIIGRPLAAADQLAIQAGFGSVNFAAGTDWMYCNGGYVLLTEVVQRVSGMAFGDFLRDRIFAPLGMHDTLARPLDLDFLPNSAALHVRNAAGGWDRGVFGPAIGGEGNVVSTIDDMLRWLRHMDRPIVGRAETWARMYLPASVTPGGSTGYGLGLVSTRYRGLPVVFHTGGVIGGTCQMLKAPDQGLDIIVITNSWDAYAAPIANQILDACVADLHPLPETVPGPFPVGDFVSPLTGRHARLIEQEGKPAADIDGTIVPLVRRADGSLWLQANFDAGAVMAPAGADVLLWHEYERTDRLERVPAAAPDATLAIAGRWRAEELGAMARVDTADGETMTIVGEHGRVAYRLVPKARGLWSLLGPKGPAGRIEHRGDALLLSTTSTRRLRFEREVA